MKMWLVVLVVGALALGGCGGDKGGDKGGVDDGGGAQSSSPGAEATAKSNRQRQRGGTITVGEHSWQIVPSMQCSVYPGDVVSISGHSESDKSLDIVIDYDPSGRSGIRIGSERGDDGWYSVKGTLKVKIDGKSVRGSGQFSSFAGGAGDIANGEFKVDC